MASRDYMLEHLEDYIVEDTDGWYFYDETRAQIFGPYTTEEECRELFVDYVDNFL
jgi:hypothetical protein